MAINTPIIAIRESGKGRRKDNVRLMAIDIPIHIIWFCRKFFVSEFIIHYTHPSCPSQIYFGLKGVKTLCNIDVIGVFLISSKLIFMRITWLYSKAHTTTSKKLKQ